VARELTDRWDNDDVRVRPGKSSRPRSKIRPGHQDSVRAVVLTVDRGRIGCLLAEGTKSERLVSAVRARELGRRGVAIGDDVDLVGDVSGKPDTLARIVRIAERHSVLRRSADDTDPTERVVVANADKLVIVTALVDPVPRPGFIDRCLVAAYTGNLRAVLVLTKGDLADPAELLAGYADLDLEVVVTSRPGGKGTAIVGVDALREQLTGCWSVLFGHSGVGKSTLVNKLVPDADRATGTVTAVGKGRHTSSSAVALRLPDGGWVVDTPGVRSLGLAHTTADDVLIAFDDLLDATAACPPGCSHLGVDAGLADCALDALVAAGGASAQRLSSFRRLVVSLADEGG
jgi:ribosome biogenesis GTPase / thiamine phosphate phosphatase